MSCQNKCLGAGVSNIWENTDIYSEHYRCAAALFLLSVLSKFYNIIIDLGVSAPGHGREVEYGLNVTNKRFIFHMMYTVQHPGSKWFNTQNTLHTAAQNTDMILAQEFQKHLSNKS